ncbi:MAG: hypothetical protein V1750_08735 [Acidobacteriota bacterium]
MRRNFLLLTLAFALASCTSAVQESPDRVGHQAAEAGIAGYLLLGDGSIHARRGDYPSDLHVRGRLVGEGFVAEGDVQGDGELGVDGHPGWMELRDGSFHGDETGRAPFRPYVHGHRAEDGVFCPDTLKVVY